MEGARVGAAGPLSPPGFWGRPLQVSVLLACLRGTRGLCVVCGVFESTNEMGEEKVRIPKIN